MAITNINTVKIPLSGSAELAELADVTTPTDGGAFDFSGNDLKTLFLFKNTNASAVKTVTIKHGDGIQGIKDLTISIAAGKIHAASLESGKYKQTTGENKGKLLFVPESADIKAACILLP